MPISGKGVVCYSGEMLRKLSLENPTCYVPGFAIIQHFPIYVFCEPCVCVCVCVCVYGWVERCINYL